MAEPRESLQVGRCSSWFPACPYGFCSANAFKQLKSIAIPQTVSAGKKVASKSALPDCCICAYLYDLRGTNILIARILKASLV